MNASQRGPPMGGRQATDCVGEGAWAAMRPGAGCDLTARRGHARSGDVRYEHGAPPGE
ncbi:Uncharacterised protein [Bordetella pertussis]|nr:Uncharacterised protein [Bordetella pertussis]